MVKKDESLYLPVLIAYDQFALNKVFKQVICFGQDGELTWGCQFLARK